MSRLRHDSIADRTLMAIVNDKSAMMTRTNYNKLLADCHWMRRNYCTMTAR